MNELNKQTTVAIKWSSVTEISSKIISPIVNMILARILAPDAFGILATVIMVISFAEVFVESGFQKFLIQHKFENAEQEHNHMSVAFWANLAFSGLIWLLVIIFCQPLASLVGNDGLGVPIAITGVTIPLYGIIGIQNCKLKKELNFKGLFYVRSSTASVPLIITLPLALLGLDYWSLIIGNISGVVLQSIFLIFIGKFKPARYFSFTVLKFMLSYGIWTMLDGIVTWMTAWVDTFLISAYMSDYYLGLYKNSTSTVNALFTIVTCALVPVLFSSLSRLQDKHDEFNNLFTTVLRWLCIILIPLSVGFYFYRNLATTIMFGENWLEAADIIGIMSLTTALRTIFVSFYSDLFRAKGKFYIPLIMQLIDIAILIPSCMIAVKGGFWLLVYVRAFLKLDLIIPSIVAAWVVCKLSPSKTFKAISHTLIPTALMISAIVIFQSISSSISWSITSIMLCIVIYVVSLFSFRKEREEFFRPLKIKLKKHK